MGAATEASGPAAGGARLRQGSLSFVECLGQSIANIAPTLTPALNIAVVAGLAGVGSWLGYLVATLAMLFVAANIGALARRASITRTERRISRSPRARRWCLP